MIEPIHTVNHAELEAAIEGAMSQNKVAILQDIWAELLAVQNRFNDLVSEWQLNQENFQESISPQVLAVLRQVPVSGKVKQTGDRVEFVLSKSSYRDFLIDNTATVNPFIKAGLQVQVKEYCY